jgi:hypothetical protein
LTAVGQSLCTALQPLQQWAVENATAVKDSRERFDAAHAATHTNRSGSARGPSFHALSGSSHSPIMATTRPDPRSRRRPADGQRAISHR